MKSRSAAWMLAAMCAAGTLDSVAGENTAAFTIKVTLVSGPGNIRIGGISGGGSGGPQGNSPGVVCTSMAEGDLKSAVVEVLCTKAAPYVAIEPAPGQASVSGEVVRGVFDRDGPVTTTMGARADFDWKYETGTVTALQVSNAAGNGSALEMLVSF